MLLVAKGEILVVKCAFAFVRRLPGSCHAPRYLISSISQLLSVDDIFQSFLLPSRVFFDRPRLFQPFQNLAPLRTSVRICTRIALADIPEVSSEPKISLSLLFIEQVVIFFRSSCNLRVSRTKEKQKKEIEIFLYLEGLQLFAAIQSPVLNLYCY